MTRVECGFCTRRMRFGSVLIARVVPVFGAVHRRCWSFLKREGVR